MAADSALAADASPEGLVADASPEGLVADASPTKVRRRVLSYEFIEDVSYGQDSVDRMRAVLACSAPRNPLNPELYTSDKGRPWTVRTSTLESTSV